MSTIQGLDWRGTNVHGSANFKHVILSEDVDI